MKNFIQRGDTVTLTAPAETNSGDPVLVGALFGVAQHDAATGDPVEAKRTGVFTLPKAASQVWTQGAKLYWSAGDANVTTADSGNTLIGAALLDAASADTEGTVVLTGQIV